MLTIDEVKHIAKLAKLNLTDDEVKMFQKQLSSILDYVKQLDEVDTDNVAPTFQVNKNVKNVFHKDGDEAYNSTQKISKKNALRNASNHNDDYFVTEAVL